MRQGPSRRSFVAALVAAVFAWLGKRPPQTPAVAPSPPPPPALPLTYAEPTSAAVTYMHSWPPIEPLPQCCALTERCVTFRYDGQGRLG